jgi:hypothetical protein
MKNQDQKTIKEQLVCWITAAVVFFCAVFPVLGLCDCENCPHSDSTCSEKSEKIIKSSRVPDCCGLVSKMVNSGDCDDNYNYCSCSCANPPSASISISNSSIVPDELKVLVFAAFLTPTETVGKLVFPINCQESPIIWLPVRLHLFLFVLLN